ncbi:unnamed protein product [Rangifer tarandus platyrhynchus]|uniref:Uncharacterized protein n=2 Tax=Rangifer tarandus platyrhynchus TaxID=3082113 RepID=A0ABN8YSF2_RANTA|nr:unnamed protein product [Rangifer tarandus platyrhynchus]CAI9702076.1 unnamed protein product [Rangifer tarandus platyrhynchus]
MQKQGLPGSARDEDSFELLMPGTDLDVGVRALGPECVGTGSSPQRLPKGPWAVGPAWGAEEKPGGYRQLGPREQGAASGRPLSLRPQGGGWGGPRGGGSRLLPSPHRQRARVWLVPRSPAPRPLSAREQPWGWTPTATGERGLGPGPRPSQTPDTGESGPGAAGSGGAKPRGYSGPPRGCRGSGSIRIERTSVSASPSAAARSAGCIVEESNPKGL